MKSVSALEKGPDYAASRWLRRPSCLPVDVPSLTALCPAQCREKPAANPRQRIQAGFWI